MARRKGVLALHRQMARRNASNRAHKIKTKGSVVQQINNARMKSWS